MLQPWPFTLQMLAGALMVPALDWPPALTRRVRIRDDDETAPEPEPEPGHGMREVLAQLRPGPMTSAELAAALGLGIDALYARTCRMRARGLIRREGRQWHVVADAPRARQNEPGEAIDLEAIA